jgi:hypothetical protein
MPPTPDSPIDVHPASLPPEALLAGCDIQFQRRSGPGGQHRNKVETAVVLRHRATGVQAMASERRQQAENRAVAIERLRIALALRVRRSWTEPSLLWRSRCQGGRIVVSARHPHLAAVLAEALDALAACGWEVAETCERLGCTSTQLVRFLRRGGALDQLNAQRASQGLPRLL